MKWITLRPYDREPLAEHETEWIWVNADKIEIMSEGSRHKSVTPPTTLLVGGSSVRVIETPSEILELTERIYGCHQQT